MNLCVHFTVFEPEVNSKSSNGLVFEKNGLECENWLGIVLFPVTIIEQRIDSNDPKRSQSLRIDCSFFYYNGLETKIGFKSNKRPRENLNFCLSAKNGGQGQKTVSSI